MMQAAWKNNWREQWIVCVLTALIAGLLVSRALVSVASALLAVPFFFSYGKVNRGPLLAVALLVFPLLVSGLWSSNTASWWHTVSVKLAVVPVMMGMFAAPLSSQKKKQLVWLLLLTLLAGCCWSLAHYSYELQQAYLRAKTLPTPMDNDHIRFSWLVSAAIWLGGYEAVRERNRTLRGALILILTFLVAYLHILAAKTGLICLYGGLLLFVLFDIIKYRKWKRGLLIAVLVALTAFTCYWSFPTLRNRIQYVMYDVQNVIQGNDMPGYTDAARWRSVRAGYAVMSEHPLTGVGAGDVLEAVNEWLKICQPKNVAGEGFLPANEWLVYGAAAGWPGFAFFTAGLLLLLYTTTKKNAWSCVLSLTCLVPVLADDTLEGQYGVVILAFIVFFGQSILIRSNT